MSRISIEVTPEQHREIKMLAAAHGVSIKDFMLDRAIYGQPRKLKPETEQALIDSRNGVGLTRFTSMEDMISYLESDDDDELNDV